jgi:uncharacterized membrane protein
MTNRQRRKQPVSTTLPGAPSTAAIAKHPLHPMVVPFPIAFLTGALAADLAYWGTDDTFWARAAFWLIGAGVVTGVVAAILGAIDFWTIERARSHRAGWIHLIGNGAALLLSVINLLLRWGEPADGVFPWGILLSVIVGLILVVTGWYGGELSYKHKVGVAE